MGWQACRSMGIMHPIYLDTYFHVIQQPPRLSALYKAVYRIIYGHKPVEPIPSQNLLTDIYIHSTYENSGYGMNDIQDAQYMLATGLYRHSARRNEHKSG